MLDWTKIECAIGGSYELPGRESFWIDRPVVMEIIKRIRPHLSEPKREYSAEDKLCKAVGLLLALKDNPEHLSEPALRQITEALNEIEGEQP